MGAKFSHTIKSDHYKVSTVLQQSVNPKHCSRVRDTGGMESSWRKRMERAWHRILRIADDRFRGYSFEIIHWRSCKIRRRGCKARQICVCCTCNFILAANCGLSLYLFHFHSSHRVSFCSRIWLLEKLNLFATQKHNIRLSFFMIAYV